MASSNLRIVHVEQQRKEWLCWTLLDICRSCPEEGYKEVGLNYRMTRGKLGRDQVLRTECEPGRL